MLGNGIPRQILYNISHQKPVLYVFIYLAAIPIFAVIFFVISISLQENSPEILNKDYSFLERFGECLYFSTVTITTLGYGDITPLDPFGKIFASLESIGGVVLVGLFLNSLSRVRSIATEVEVIEREEALSLCSGD